MPGFQTWILICARGGFWRGCDCNCIVGEEAVHSNYGPLMTHTRYNPHLSW
jgi:hypothetical protein